MQKKFFKITRLKNGFLNSEKIRKIKTFFNHKKRKYSENYIAVWGKDNEKMYQKYEKKTFF